MKVERITVGNGILLSYTYNDNCTCDPELRHTIREMASYLLINDTVILKIWLEISMQI